MGIEIERKFLVTGEAWRSMGQSIPLVQGYLAGSDQATVRVRIAGDTGFLTVKGRVKNLTRQEFEYEIPVADAEAMMDLCQPRVVEKTRYKIPIENLIWEVDEFAGTNQGLVLAEVELTSPEQFVSLPSWIGLEVSDDPRYFNSYLAAHPYSTWPNGSSPHPE
ncbi:CYTH domain-containing protein [Acaryochloris marina]|uniref:Adenylate cyclase, putative n=1 Tax=Acaryochloris marina (strain MBIC 11017) TaxID=329726 RepID=B0C9B7_ACAM1|nr:CYTH domain-containing protein [Acaryochloris marina]ABW27798.1 adenylate cyclase, putative [Acaryochloris marina MBIC11017]BDM82526.1 CYTH domain-containing protein [Acaryochloris marina MBIC10699]